jgi:transcription termination/antitermination protein NusG
MAQVLAPKDQWFVVHVLSGQENKVRDNIEKRVKTEEMSDVIFKVLVPTERVSEIKRGKKSETTRKFFPGYLIVNMHLLDENNQLVGRTWYFIRETTGVIGFAGTKDKPIPMRKSEVDNMLAQLRSGRDGEGGRRTFPESKRHRRRDRSRSRKAAGIGDNFRPRHAGRVGILAGGTGIN